MKEPMEEQGACEQGGAWFDRLAAETETETRSEARSETRSETEGTDDGPAIVCASGISPSGPIHMGNLREVLTAHLVAEALRHRGHAAVHLHSWDDYDRLRKVPAGVDGSFAEHIGRPLSAVPDPFGAQGSWADRYIAQFVEAAATLGVALHEVRQSEQYPAGTYNGSIRRAMDERAAIFDILEARQTEGRQGDPVEVRRAGYFPYKPYCGACGRDTTTVAAYAREVVAYSCACGHTAEQSLADGLPISGKLAWKVDWPMRWAHEGVAFEPAGEDHHSPSGSFGVGRDIVSSVFGGRAPRTATYSFVGLAGAQGKMSGSQGAAPVPAAALELLEPAIVRWVYARRAPNQAFSIDLSPGAVQRLYDEWDRFGAHAADAGATEVERRLDAVSRRTSAGEVAASAVPVGFRLLGAVADLTQGDRAQIARIVADHRPEGEAATGEALLDRLEPRLGCALRWAASLPDDERTVVRGDFDAEAWADLDDPTRHGLHELVGRMPAAWTLTGLTALIYTIPKYLHGVAEDQPATPEVKKAQRGFFKAAYRLLVSRETGPRLPTLLLSIGQERAAALLVGATADPGPPGP